jgi:hypothetical protein
MKHIALTALCLLPLLAWGEDGPTALQALGLSGEQSGPGCVSTCEATLVACKQACRDTTARGDVRHFDEADVSVPVCISDCETEASICNKDC